jgi:ATP-binding protein involved in chromosome partitioning
MDKAYFSLTVPAARAQELEPLREAAERATKTVPGSRARWCLDRQPRTGHRGPSPRRPRRRSVPPIRMRRAQPQGRTKAGVPGIGAIIAVASGKGGVGKSTTAVNLALGLQASGLKIGVLDADIYGPSMPRLLGINGRPEQLEGRMLKPMENYGLKVMSMGFLVEEDTPMIWRGPMVMSALNQMLREVAWGELDVWLSTCRRAPATRSSPWRRTCRWPVR